MRLKELRELFGAGKITKADFIDRMHGIHACLFDYAAHLPSTDIARIEISDGLVAMVSRADGVRIVCDPDDKRIAPIEILNFLDYEKADSDMLFSLVHDGDRILDVGANIGWYSISLARRFPRSRVDAFEPVPRTFAFLERNVGLNSVPGVRTHPFGLSDKAAELTFYYDPAGSGAASSAAGDPGLREVRGRVLTMDEFVRSEGGRGPVDFIKCDVEGAELLVFRGATETLERSKPIVFSEMLRKWSAKFGYHPNDIIRLFTDLGYGCFVVRGGRLAELPAVDENTVETNYFFLHRDKYAAQIRERL